MLCHHTLQRDGASLGVSNQVRGEDLCPGGAGDGVTSQGQGRDHRAMAGLSDCEADQDGGCRSGVDLAPVLALVTAFHLRYLHNFGMSLY